MEVIGERHDRGPRAEHDGARIFPLLRLTMQVGHRARVPAREPLLELGGVRVAIESRNPGRRESQRRCSAFELDALLDGVHSPIVSRRQRAKFTMSRTGGTACSSP